MTAALRSALFVPGDSTQKLVKSLGSGADVFTNAYSSRIKPVARP